MKMQPSGKVGELCGDDQTSDGGRGQGRKDTGNEGGEGESRNVAATGRGQLAQNTNLDTQGADVAETAEGIGGNELGARRQALIVGTYGNDLLGNELGNLEEIAVSRNTEQEGHRVEDVGQDGLQSQGGVVDVDVVAPPGEEAVDEADGGEDAEERGDDGAANLDAEPGAVGEGVQGVFGLVLVVVGDDDAAGGQGLLRLGIAELGDGQGGGDGHDAGGDEGLGVEAEADVADQDGAGDCGEAAGHDLVQLGVGHVGDEGADQHGGLALADEGGGGGDDGLGAGGVEGPEDEGGHLLDEPLDEADVVEDLDEGDEEDDGGDDAEEEVGQGGDLGGGEEGDALVGEAEQVAGAVGDELEDVVADAGAEDEEADDVLAQHAADDGAPVDLAAVPAGGPEDGDDDEHAEEADGAVLARVVGALLGDEGADQDGGDRDEGAGGGAQPRGDAVVDDQRRVGPNPLDGVGQEAHGHVEEEEADGDGQPQQEGDDPVLVVAVQDQRRDPPAGEEQEDDEVDGGAEEAVGDAKVPAALRADLVRVEAGPHHVRPAALFVVAVVGRRVGSRLVVAVVLRGDQRRVHVGALCVDGIVVAGGVNAGRVVLVLVMVLVSRLQGGIRVVVDALDGGGGLF
ncbi:hypothetical protein Trco_007200 [Trichoderma cornu-damae]|uniref:Uncharacterized protein n=1 Tax=Trichoderma cornu-damae TaxID=654480 RepID=A0A9P8TSW6_9HYPO|nr:hypothetical protein Trco_007200 [Trichoderma cornu-damae]